MRKGSAGFSLIEIVIVLSIIGILAGLSAPRLMYVLKAREATTCAVNRINVQNAERNYVVDHSVPSSNIDVLIQGGYLQSYPVCPTGGTYLWLNDATTENPFRNLGCSVHYFPPNLPAGPSVLFSTEFNNMKGLSPLQGSWSITNGALNPTDIGQEHRLAFGDKTWKDYDIKVNATLTQGNGYGIYYRADGKPNMTGYVFQYDPGLGNKFVVRKVVNGQEQQPFQQVNMPPNFPVYNQSHEISVSVQGDHHIIKIDSQPVLDFQDNTFTSGMGGLRSWNNTKVAFDNLNVTQH